MGRLNPLPIPALTTGMSARGAVTLALTATVLAIALSPSQTGKSTSRMLADHASAPRIVDPPHVDAGAGECAAPREALFARRLAIELVANGDLDGLRLALLTEDGETRIAVLGGRDDAQRTRVLDRIGGELQAGRLRLWPVNGGEITWRAWDRLHAVMGLPVGWSLLVPVYGTRTSSGCRARAPLEPKAPG